MQIFYEDLQQSFGVVWHSSSLPLSHRTHAETLLVRSRKDKVVINNTDVICDRKNENEWQNELSFVDQINLTGIFHHLLDGI